ncbi:LOW QUALITY PROTEIN: hypothetical protein U9M48_021056, partial [Paspalum notatum var. saurae]
GKGVRQIYPACRLPGNKKVKEKLLFIIRRSSSQGEPGSGAGACAAAAAAVEEVVRDAVARGDGGRGPHGVVGDHVVVEELEVDLRVDGVAGALADVVEHAAGAEHDGEVLQLHLGALLQAPPARLESPEGVPGDGAHAVDALVEHVLRPRHVGVRGTSSQSMSGYPAPPTTHCPRSSPAAPRFSYSADRSSTSASDMEPGQPMQTSVKAPAASTTPCTVME